MKAPWKKKNNIKSAVKLLLFILGDHKNEWSGNRTESLRSGWPYIFSLWARWKAPFAIFCSAEAIHKSKGWGGASMTVPLEKFLCSHMMQLQEVKSSLGHDYYTIVPSAVKDHT